MSTSPGTPNQRPSPPIPRSLAASFRAWFRPTRLFPRLVYHTQDPAATATNHRLRIAFEPGNLRVPKRSLLGKEKQFHPDPNPMETLDPDAEDCWETHIKRRLNPEIRRVLGTRSGCVAQLLKGSIKIGDEVQPSRATVVISCSQENGTSRTYRLLQRDLDTSWIERDWNIPCVIACYEVGPIAATFRIENTTTHFGEVGTNLVIEIPRALVSTFSILACGLRLVYPTSYRTWANKCTLGGLITIDGKVFGLTVAHCFDKIGRDRGSEEAMSEKTLLPEDDISDAESKPISAAGNAAVAESCANDSQPYWENFGEVIAMSRSESSDWGLVFIDNQRMQFWNEYQDAITKQPVAVSSFIDNKALKQCLVRDGPAGVIVMTAFSGVHTGKLYSRTTEWNFGGRNIKVYTISLDTPLVHGDSGSWAMMSDTKAVCGMVIGSQPNLRLAFMITIENIFKDIKAQLGGSNFDIAKGFPGESNSSRHRKSSRSRRGSLVHSPASLTRRASQPSLRNVSPAKSGIKRSTTGYQTSLPFMPPEENQNTAARAARKPGVNSVDFIVEAKVQGAQHPTKVVSDTLPPREDFNRFQTMTPNASQVTIKNPDSETDWNSIFSRARISGSSLSSFNSNWSHARAQRQNSGDSSIPPVPHNRVSQLSRNTQGHDADMLRRKLQSQMEISEVRAKRIRELEAEVALSRATKATTTLTANLDPPSAEPDSWSSAAILSLDGGGVRGYWSLLVLERLMVHIAQVESHLSSPAPSSFHPVADSCKNAQEESSPLRRYLPCHYFDYMFGSSTGALIALMLGRLRMSVHDCKSEYESICEILYPRSRSWVSREFSHSRRNRRAKVLENELHKSIAKHIPAGDNTRLSTNPGICQVCVVTSEVVVQKRRRLSRGLHMQPRLFRSWATSRQPTMSPDFEVWQAARAATAGPLFPEPLEVRSPQSTTHKLYMDAGACVNNPASWAIDEVSSLPTVNAVDLLLSIGPNSERTKVARESRGSFQNSFEEHRDLQIMSIDKGFSYYRFSELPEIESSHTAPPENANGKAHDVWSFGDILSGVGAWISDDVKGARPSTEQLRSSFAEWQSQEANVDQLRSAAERLVRLRRARTRDLSRWHRFATSATYACKNTHCQEVFWWQSDLDIHEKSSHGKQPRERDKAERLRERPDDWETPSLG